MERIGIIGGGLIGAGWAALFAHAGYAVDVLDPDQATAGRLDAVAATASRMLIETAGAHRGGSVKHVRDVEALAGSDFVQECLPETLRLKVDVLTSVEPVLAAGVPIASSSSGLDPDEIAANLADPSRLLIGHPCNPPYLMPVVELVAGPRTSPDAVAMARAVYEHAGRTVIVAGRTVPGHIVNRLQAALWREMLHLWQSGVADLDTLGLAVSRGLAPRWCVIGPTEVFQVAGGPQGIAGFCHALGPQVDRWWADLGAPRFDDALADTLIRERGGASTAVLEDRRDAGVPLILSCCEQAARLPTTRED